MLKQLFKVITNWCNRAKAVYYFSKLRNKLLVGKKEMPKEFKTKLKINALPEEVYDALTKPFAIELWSGAPAIMSTEPNSEFELWEGDICGRNIRFEENRQIEQERYFGESEDMSGVTFKIFADGKQKSTLIITHTNIPDADYDDMVAGWNEVYIAPLKHFLEDEE